MTDERIIDGIDVSECDYYSDADYDYCYMDSSEFGSAYCYDNHYCYFKQLKRKEQECEELEKQLVDLNAIIDHFLMASGKSKDITEPEEFEEVFEDIEATYSECGELKNLFEDPEVRVALADVRTGEREVWRKLGNKAQKYEQVLNRIEQICKDGAYDEYKMPLDECNVILDLLNKVKENNLV